MSGAIVVVGSINADLVLQVARHPHPGETVLGRDSVLMSGGKGANQAVAAARLGARVAMVGAVGSDSTATVALAGLRDAGVDLTHVPTVPGTTGLAVVTLSQDAENSIVVIPGANLAVTVDAVDAARDVIVAAQVCVLQAEIPLPAVARAAQLAHDAGTRVLLNVAPATALPPGTLRLADPLVVNEHEAAVILGRPIDSPADAAADLAALGIASVVITLGSHGAVVLEGGRLTSLPARMVVPRDTTGAGDAFVGALAAGLVEGSTILDAAQQAVRVAAASVTRLGAQASYPWKEEPLP
ncbi:ribokinase [Cellulomonas sp. URHE0023]|uniref:ribokinase n=1 Tax=Cellulomonas sp. URHE0023 TaxID=1380354 RepID=UPI0004821D57|nr:ribokinase [Cellulomonas sp. URHE0023]